MLAQLLQAREGCAAEALLQKVAKEAEGYMPADLCQLVERATLAATRRQLGSDDESDDCDVVEISDADFAVAVDGFTPLGLKGIDLHKSEIEWEDVGGMSTPELLSFAYCLFSFSISHMCITLSSSHFHTRTRTLSNSPSLGLSMSPVFSPFGGLCMCFFLGLLSVKVSFSQGLLSFPGLRTLV